MLFMLVSCSLCAKSISEKSAEYAQQWNRELMYEPMTMLNVNDNNKLIFFHNIHT